MLNPDKPPPPKRSCDAPTASVSPRATPKGNPEKVLCERKWTS